MKKFSVLFLLLAVLITAVACAKENENTPDGSDSESVSEIQNASDDIINSDSESTDESENESESNTHGWAERDEDATVVTGDHTPFY